MAKDGTNRGGARPGAGRKPKALKEKLDAGNPGNHPLRRLDIPENIEGVDMPKPSDYLSAMQRDGKPLGADEIYTKMCRWLGKLGCDKLVNPLLVEQYSMCAANVCGKMDAVRRSCNEVRSCRQASDSNNIGGAKPVCIHEPQLSETSSADVAANLPGG